MPIRATHTASALIAPQIAFDDQSGNTPRVLIVDDSPVERHMLDKVCTSLGYETLMARDGPQALALIKSHPIQMVLADWDMSPGMDGIELCKAVRQLDHGYHIYFVITSSHDSQSYVLKALEAGVDQFIPKPVSATELRMRLRSASKIVRLQQKSHELNQSLQQAHQETRRDLRALAALQQSLLPKSRFADGRLIATSLFLPKKIVSGDHMSVQLLTEEIASFYTIDVVGHGVSSAVQAMALSRILSLHPNEGILIERYQDNRQVHRIRSPAEVAGMLNRRYQLNERSDLYFSMIYGLLNLRTGEVTMCMCGLPYPIVVKPDGRCVMVGNPGFPIGVVEDGAYTDYHFKLESNDRLYLYTDGLVELRNKNNNQLTAAQITAHLEKTHRLGLTDQVKSIQRLAYEWASGDPGRPSQEDDLSVLALLWRDERDFRNEDGNWLPQEDFLTLPPQDADDDTLPLEDEALPVHEEHLVILSAQTELVQRLTKKVKPFDIECKLVTLDQLLSICINTDRMQFIVVDCVTVDYAHVMSLFMLLPAHTRNRLYLLRLTEPSSIDSEDLSSQVFAEEVIYLPYKPTEMLARIISGWRILKAYNAMVDKSLRTAAINKSLTSDMESVFSVQVQNLPDTLKSYGQFRFNWIYKPARYVSGDFINIIRLDDETICFYCLDAEGAGIIAAVIAWTMTQLLSKGVKDSLLFKPEEEWDQHSPHYRLPSQVLSELNIRAIRSFHNDRACSITYGILNTRTGLGKMAQAGSPDATIVRSNGRAERLGITSSNPVGLDIYSTYQDFSFFLRPGDQLYVYSDGLSDIKNADNKTLGDDGVIELIESSYDNDLQQAIDNIMDRCKRHQGVSGDLKLVNDLSVLMLRYGEQEPVEQRTMNVGELLDLKTPFHCMPGWPQSLPVAGMVLEGQINPSFGLLMAKRVSEFMGKFQGSEVDQQFCALAIVEVCTNLFRHGYESANRRDVELFALAFDGYAVICVNDWGQQIPQNFLLKAQTHDFDFDPTDINNAPEGGMGLALIMSTMDDILYTSANGKNSFYLCKKLTSDSDIDA